MPNWRKGSVVVAGGASAHSPRGYLRPGLARPQAAIVVALVVQSPRQPNRRDSVVVARAAIGRRLLPRPSGLPVKKAEHSINWRKLGEILACQHEMHLTAKTRS